MRLMAMMMMKRTIMSYITNNIEDVTIKTCWRVQKIFQHLIKNGRSHTSNFTKNNDGLL